MKNKTEELINNRIKLSDLESLHKIKRENRLIREKIGKELELLHKKRIEEAYDELAVYFSGKGYLEQQKTELKLEFTNSNGMSIMIDQSLNNIPNNSVGNIIINMEGLSVRYTFKIMTVFKSEKYVDCMSFSNKVEDMKAQTEKMKQINNLDDLTVTRYGILNLQSDLEKSGIKFEGIDFKYYDNLIDALEINGF